MAWVMGYFFKCNTYDDSQMRCAFLFCLMSSVSRIEVTTKHQNRSIQITKPTSAAFSFRDGSMLVVLSMKLDVDEDADEGGPSSNNTPL